MVKAAERAAVIGATALQIFSDNPTAWQRRAEPSPEIAAFRGRLAQHGIAPLAIHASYLINLAGADDDLRERSIGLLTAELVTARAFGARYVNIHVGSHRGAGLEAGIDRIVGGLVTALAAESVPESTGAADDGPDAANTEPATITLENSAGGGWGLGVDVPELAAIAAALERAGVGRDRVAFCLDTAHAWGAGHDLSDPAAIDRLLVAWDAEIGLDRLRLVHLNDTRSELGSRTDRHEHLAAGRIGAVGLAHLLRHPLLAHATWILETPGMEEGYDAINLARAIALARGEPLAPLPQGALTLPASRARVAGSPVAPKAGKAGQTLAIGETSRPGKTRETGKVGRPIAARAGEPDRA